MKCWIWNINIHNSKNFITIIFRFPGSYFLHSVSSDFDVIFFMLDDILESLFVLFPELNFLIRFNSVLYNIYSWRVLTCLNGLSLASFERKCYCWSQDSDQIKILSAKFKRSFTLPSSSEIGLRWINRALVFCKLHWSTVLWRENGCKV